MQIAQDQLRIEGPQPVIVPKFWKIWSPEEVNSNP